MFTRTSTRRALSFSCTHTCEYHACARVIGVRARTRRWWPWWQCQATHSRLAMADEAQRAAVRAERARRKEEQAAEDAQDQDGSVWELRYTFAPPVGELRVVEDWSGEGNGIAGLQWLGGVMLCRYMDSRQVFPEDFFRGKRIIEVGAGCGLTSIYAALRGGDVLLTDMDVDKCVDSIDANFAERGREMPSLRVEQLVWGETDVAPLQPPFDIILAGDCLYQEACIEPLLQTMHSLADDKTLVLLCGAVGPKIIDGFNARVDAYFERTVVDTKTIDTLSDEATSAPLPSRSHQCSGSVVGAGDPQPGQRALLIMKKRSGAAAHQAVAAAATEAAEAPHCL